MARTLLVRGFLATAVAVLLAGWATPAHAQQGSLRGKVVDQQGKPVEGADVTIDFVGEKKVTFTVKTDKKGEWIQAGLPVSAVGKWNVSAHKGDLSGSLPKAIDVPANGMTKADDITIKAGGETNLSAEEVARRNKEIEEINKISAAVNAAIAAGNFDEALTQLNTLVTKNPKCAVCFAKLGEIYQTKKDNDNAEKNYLKAIELDPTLTDAYDALAGLYNGEQKFDKAAEMSAKSNEIQSKASGATGGGGNAKSTFNQGIILWNQNKFADAKVQFQKAVDLDPKLADAQYWLGMACVNEGKLPDAKKPFEEYLKLDPTGQYAATAKALLDQIK
jgi:tetratricopeptide (TPR) repeat protein